MKEKAPQRKQITLDRHRVRISELLLQHYKKADIIDVIEHEFDIRLTIRQLDNDIDAIQMTWLAQTGANHDLMVNQELARLDALETELWRQLRKSAEPKVKEVIDRLPKKLTEELTEEEVGFIIARVSSTKESGAVNPVYFSKIIDVQKERRRLLGLYASKKVDVDFRHTVNVKGYDVISPDDWDVAIEGKIIEKLEGKELMIDG